MRMLVSLIALAALAACGASSAQENREGERRAEPSGETGTRSFALQNFDKVDLRGPDDVAISVGGAFAVEAEGDAAELDRLRIEVVRGELRIGREGDREWFSWGGDDSRALRIRVTMPAIRAASVTGSGDMTIDRASAESFEAAIAGSGNLTIASLEARRAAFDIAGSGDIEAAGTAGQVDIGIAGSGNVLARDLRAETLEANIVGSGDVEAFATRTAEASLLGSGDVVVRGGARCSSNSMGSGELRCES